MLWLIYNKSDINVDRACKSDNALIKINLSSQHVVKLVVSLALLFSVSLETFFFFQIFFASSDKLLMIRQ